MAAVARRRRLFGRKDPSAALNRTLRRLKAKATKKNAKAIDAVMASSAMSKELQDRLDGLAVETGEFEQLRAVEGERGFFERLLLWLWEHREQILAFIKTIVALFGVVV